MPLLLSEPWGVHQGFQRRGAVCAGRPAGASAAALAVPRSGGSADALRIPVRARSRAPLARRAVPAVAIRGPGQAVHRLVVLVGPWQTPLCRCRERWQSTGMLLQGIRASPATWEKAGRALVRVAHRTPCGVSPHAGFDRPSLRSADASGPASSFGPARFACRVVGVGRGRCLVQPSFLTPSPCSRL